MQNRTEQRTLNPRVRGSSPWRRTRPDLVLYPRRALMLILCGAGLRPSWGRRHQLARARSGFVLATGQAGSIQPHRAYRADRRCIDVFG